MTIASVKEPTDLSVNNKFTSEKMHLFTASQSDRLARSCLHRLVGFSRE